MFLPRDSVPPMITTCPAVEGTDANFEQEVLRSPVPVLVDFWAQWCPPCRSLSPVVDEIAAELAGAAKVVKVNVEDNPDLTRRYKVQSVPLLLFFKDGEVRDCVPDRTNKDALLSRLAALL